MNSSKVVTKNGWRFEISKSVHSGRYYARSAETDFDSVVTKESNQYAGACMDCGMHISRHQASFFLGNEERMVSGFYSTCDCKNPGRKVAAEPVLRENEAERKFQKLFGISTDEFMKQ